MLTREIQTKNVMTKSSLPVGGYSVNPYVGCPHACKYCYASFMKRFTGHTEPWGTFVDAKYWPVIKNPQKYSGELVVIGSVTDGYNPLEEKYGRTRELLNQLRNSNAKIMICTKSDLVLRDLDILTQMQNVTVSWSINTLEEKFKNEMDEAVSIERRLNAMKTVYDAGIRTVCFISPVFPGITDVRAITEKVKNQCDFIWMENLNLRGDYKTVIMNYIKEIHPSLYPLYQKIYIKRDKEYWQKLVQQMQSYAEENDFPFIDNFLPDGRSQTGKPAIINYLYHEEIRGSENKGTRKGAHQ